jgi:hypothetical protein
MCRSTDDPGGVGGYKPGSIAKQLGSQSTYYGAGGSAGAGGAAAWSNGYLTGAGAGGDVAGYGDTGWVRAVQVRVT